MKYAWVDAYREEFALSELCRVLGVSVSGYRAWKGGGTADRQGLTEAQLLVLIQSSSRGPTAAREWSESCAHGAFRPVSHGWSG